MKKGAIRSGFDESSPFTRHYPTLQKRAKTAKATVVGISNDDMVEDFDFEKLARSNSAFLRRLIGRNPVLKAALGDYREGNTSRGRFA